MAEIASLFISIDSTSATKAAGELDSVSAAAARAADANSRLGAAASTAASSQNQVAAAAATTANTVNTASDRLLGNLERQIALFGASSEAIAHYNGVMAGMVGAELDWYKAQTLTLDSMRQQAAATAQAAAEAATATAAQDRFIASLKTQVETLGMSSEQLLAYKAAQLGVTEQAGPLIAALEAQKRAMAAPAGAAGGETEAQAAARYQAISAAAQEYAATQGEAAVVAERYAASVDEMAAAATKATGAQAALNEQVTAGAAAQERAALIKAQTAVMSPASQAVTAGAGAETAAANDDATASINKMEQALLRQQVAVSESRSQLAAYDAALAGATEGQQAYIASLAKEVEVRRAQMALGTEMAAALDAEAAAATRSAFASTQFVREVAVIFRELAEGRVTYAIASFTRLLSFTNLLTLAFNPLTIAVGVLGYAAVKGAEQYSALSNALLSTGNAAGTTAGALDAVVQKIAATGERAGVAADAITKLAESGRFSATQIATIGQAATAMSDVTGVAVDKVVQEFVKLQEDPVKASAELNAQYHYLTASVFEQIDALAKQGDAVGAANLAESAYSDALKQRAGEARASMGAVESAWKTLGEAASAAWQSMLNIGKPQTLEDQLDQVTKALAAARAGVNTRTTGGALSFALGSTEAVQAPGGNVDQLQQQQANLQEQQRMQQRGAEAQARDAADNKAAIAGQQVIDRVQKEVDKRSELTKQLEQERAAVAAVNAEAAKGNGTAITPAQQQEMEAGLARRYRQPAVPGAAAGSAAEANQPRVDLQTQFSQQQKLLQDQQKILDDNHKAQLVSDQDFYSQEASLNAQDVQNKLTYYAKLEQMARADMASSGTNVKQRVTDQEAITKAQSDSSVALADFAAKQTAVSDQVATAQNKQSDTVKAYIDSLNQRIAKEAEADAQSMRSAGVTTRGRADPYSAAQVGENEAVQVQGIQARVGQGGTGGLSQPQADQMVTALKAADQQMVQSHQAATQQISEADKSWSTGAVSAWDNWSKQAGNMSGQVSKATTSLLDGMTNQVLQFAETGKANFQGLAASFVQALAKMEIQAAESSVFKLLGGAAAPGGAAGLGLGPGLLGGLLQSFGAGATSSAAGLGLAGGLGSDVASSTAGIASSMGVGGFNAFSGAFSTGLPGFATGGHVSGPGTGTSDSIAAKLSNGEFVVNAAATAQHRPLLEALNGGNRGYAGKTHFADGGLATPAAGGNAGQTNIGFHIYQGSGQSSSNNASAQGQTRSAALHKELESVVIETVRKHSLPGGQINQIIRTAVA